MKILAIGAHPDDIEIFMYGFLCACLNRGDHIFTAIATDGSLGGENPGKELAIKRKNEAKIGLKEGLEGGEKFDVLELGFTSSGARKWKKKATIKVDKKAIWDNRYFSTKPPEAESKDAIVATSFKGCKKKWELLTLLLRQQK